MNGSIPTGAVRAGTDSGRDVFVARAEHRGLMIPGKIVFGQRVAYVSYGGMEHSNPIYQVPTPQILRT